MLKKVFAKLNELIIEAITEALRIEGVSKDVINNYVNEAGDIYYAKTANRSLVARTNNYVQMVYAFDEYLAKETVHQPYLSLLANRDVQDYGNRDIDLPADRMKQRLVSSGAIKESLDVEMYQL